MTWKKELLDLAVDKLDYDPTRLETQKKNKDRRLDRAIQFKLLQEGRALQRESRYKRLAYQPIP